MATELNTQISPIEMERLQTSIRYHDWFLGFVVVVGVSLSVYLVDSMDTLKEDMADVRTRVEVTQTNIDAMQEDIRMIHATIETMQEEMDVMQNDIGALHQKMDRYHSGIR